MTSLREILGRKVLATLLLLTALALSGCGSEGPGGSAKSGSTSTPAVASTAPLLPDDFKSVCTGATQSRATAYDTAAGSHKAMYFATYKETLLDQSSSLPADWTVVFAATGNPLQAIDLVACATRTSAKEVKTCDGYKDDGKETGNKVRMHTATYDVSVRAASTGDEIAKKTMAGNDGSCPMIASFDGKNQTIDQYASIPAEQITAFLKPLVQP